MNRTIRFVPGFLAVMGLPALGGAAPDDGTCSFSVSLKTKKGPYVSADRKNRKEALFATATSAKEWEKFKIVKHVCTEAVLKNGDNVWIQTDDGYTVRIDHQNGNLIADVPPQSSLYPWAKNFFVERIDKKSAPIETGTEIGFRYFADKRTVMAGEGGGVNAAKKRFPLRIKEKHLKEWETFKVEIHAKGKPPAAGSWVHKLGKPAKAHGMLGQALKKSPTGEKYEALAKKYPGIGEPVSIASLLKRIQELVKTGELPAGEKGISDLSSCPNEVDKGPVCVAPIKRYQQILPDIDSFLELAWDRVMLRYEKGRAYSPDELVPIFFNFGCRQISRGMPGYAKIELVKRKSGIDTSGDWTKTVDPEADKEAINEALGIKTKGESGKKDDGPPAYKPPPKEEVIEVCKMSHPQLEATLNKDIRLLIKGDRIKQLHVVVDRNYKQIGDDSNPIRGKGNPFEEDGHQIPDFHAVMKHLADKVVGVGGSSAKSGLSTSTTPAKN